MNRAASALLRSSRTAAAVSALNPGRRSIHKSISGGVLGSNKNDGGPFHPDPPADAPGIPPFVEKFDEPVAEKRSRLLYQSRKRGILENGLLLASFADKHLHTFNEEELCLYDRLINLPSNDWEIYYWATGVKPVPEEFRNAVTDRLVEHARNKDRESRLQQPALKQQ